MFYFISVSKMSLESIYIYSSVTINVTSFYKNNIYGFRFFKYRVLHELSFVE